MNHRPNKHPIDWWVEFIFIAVCVGLSVASILTLIAVLSL